jgi:uncharacterized membrane protein
VSGDDVYAAGYIAQGYTHRAALWKNGDVSHLGHESIRSCAYSVYVPGGDVYVAGEEEDGQGAEVATLWENAKPKRLGNGPGDSSAVSVHAANGGVYVAGREECFVPGDVLDDDVYVAGEEDDERAADEN